MNSKFAGPLAAALVLLASATPAAAAVRYVATIQAIGTIDYTAPGFITVNPTDVSPDQANCAVVAPLGPFPCTNVRFLPNPNGFDTIAINYSPLGFPQTIAGSFAPGSFGAYGSYTSTDTAVPLSTLTVSEVGAVPEAATWAMLIAGFGFIGGMMRRPNRILWGKEDAPRAADTGLDDERETAA